MGWVCHGLGDRFGHEDAWEWGGRHFHRSLCRNPTYRDLGEFGAKGGAGCRSLGWPKFVAATLAWPLVAEDTWLPFCFSWNIAIDSESTCVGQWNYLLAAESW